ncbi:hypothetical protein DIT71_17460 [Marinobacter vulgaris]|uniref:Zinc ribbon domain-containing protein n=1 Tax=Marinobacter vulgaris TaxID=1928331 RepID=A0A2V3ZFR8_9GAMM|nr:hypothetical protein [Marinobacter vulgaris]PXX88368.1 hypothetical protein DIT71_17460 [Marinobacter vulgaris]TSJ66064.1 hypothetical protein FPC41_17520 [Marinobacter vulgaris]
MALIACPECQKEVSEQATKCPSCSFILRKADRSMPNKIALGGFVAVTVLAPLITYVSGNTVTGNVALMTLFVGFPAFGIAALVTRPKH